MANKVEDNVPDDDKDKAPDEVKDEVPEEEKDKVPDVIEEDKDKDVPTDDDDVVAKAMKENEELRKKLEALKNSSKDVFEQNEALKAELAQAEKLAKIAQENLELTEQLKAIKKNALIDKLIAGRSITKDMRQWAEKMDFEMLDEFSRHAPQKMTVLNEKNVVEKTDKELEEWHRKESAARIHHNQKPQ